MKPIAIIGAGMAGLAAAQRLSEAGRAVQIFDKSRGLGGRLATRRAGALRINHGAPCVTVTSPGFRAWLLALDATVQGNRAWGVPGMSALLRPVARALDIAHGIEIEHISESVGGHQLTDSHGQTHGPLAAVILALPAPQVAGIAPELSGALEPVRMAPVWTLLMATEGRLDLPDRGPAPFETIASTPDQPGTVWACHTTTDFAARCLEEDKPAMAARLFSRLQEGLGPIPTPTYLAAHRWRYGRVAVPLGEPFAGSAERGVVAGGDWALGNDAEAAWLSGRAMADALLFKGAESP